MPFHRIRRLALALAALAATAGLGCAQTTSDGASAPAEGWGATVAPAPGPGANATGDGLWRSMEWGFTPVERGFAPGETTGAGSDDWPTASGAPTGSAPDAR